MYRYAICRGGAKAVKSLIWLRKTDRNQILFNAGILTAGCVSGYVYEEPLLYDTFPEDFVWGTATAAYQAMHHVVI
jgi:hypothetical protein